MRRAVLLVIVFICIPAVGFAENGGDNERELYEENSTVNYGVDIDFNSRYVWRGIALSGGAVMQPSAWVSAFDFTFEVWGNFVLNDEANQGEFNEVDFYLYYVREWKKIILEPLIQFYVYPNQGDAPATGEISLKLSYPIGAFYIFTSHIFDVVEYKGSYFGDAGLSYEHEFNSKLSLEASGGLGWASSEFNGVNIDLPKSALNLVGVNLSLTYYIKEFLYVSPHAEFSAIIDGDLRNELDDPTVINFGLAVGAEF